MKTIILTSLLTAMLFLPAIAQQYSQPGANDTASFPSVPNSHAMTTDSKIPEKNMYLEKSKKQLSTGWFLLGTGTVAVAIGALVGLGREASFSEAGTGAVIAGVGALTALSSIPVFISSSINKRRANLAFHFGEKRLPGLVRGKGNFARVGIAVAINR